VNREALADPDFFEIPEKELLSQEWAQSRAGWIRFEKVLKKNGSRDPLPEAMKKPARTSILVADPQGNRVALSSTLGDAFGSAVKVSDYGFFLNNQLTDFDMDLKTRMIRRPRMSCSRPKTAERGGTGFVFKEGRPVLILDSYGPKNLRRYF